MFTNQRIDEDEINAHLQKKLLWLLVLTGCIANMIGFLSNVILFGMSLPTIVCGICEIVMITCAVAGISFGKQKSATVIMVLMLALIEFPFLFYVYGATMGVYLILGIVALAVYFPRPYHIPAIILTAVIDIIVIILNYVHPSGLEELTRESGLETMLCSYLIVATATAVILCILLHQYARQRRQLLAISQQLEYAAHRDSLTGVYNRRYLINVLKQWMNTEHKHFLAVLIDVDDFKNINDTYGHVYGDEVLAELTRLMQQEIGEKGIVARYGGEEFMLLFEEPDRDAVREILEKIRSGLGEYSMRTKQIVITFSGGVEEYQTDAKLDELFRGADKKLYQAKNSGKNQVIF